MSIRKYACQPPTSLMSRLPCPELTRVLAITEDMAVGRSSSAAAFAVTLARHRDTDDHITASFEPMESDAAVEERVSRVESVETTWESDEECPVFGHEVEMIKDAAARMIPPNRVNKCIGLCYRNWGQLHQIGHKKFCCV